MYEYPVARGGENRGSCGALSYSLYMGQARDSYSRMNGEWKLLKFSSLRTRGGESESRPRYGLPAWRNGQPIVRTYRFRVRLLKVVTLLSHARRRR